MQFTRGTSRDLGEVLRLVLNLPPSWTLTTYDSATQSRQQVVALAHVSGWCERMVVDDQEIHDHFSAALTAVLDWIQSTAVPDDPIMPKNPVVLDSHSHKVDVMKPPAHGGWSMSFGGNNGVNAPGWTLGPPREVFVPVQVVFSPTWAEPPRPALVPVPGVRRIDLDE